MYMDNIKVFVKNEKELETQIETIRIYNKDIGIEFGIENWAMLIMKKVNKESVEGIEEPNQESLKNPEKKKFQYARILEEKEMRLKIKRIYQNKKTFALQ